MLKDEYFFFLIENISQICFSDSEREDITLQLGSSRQKIP